MRGHRHAPAALYPPRKTRYPLCRRLGGPQGRSGQMRKISPPPGFDPLTIQSVASRYTDYDTRPRKSMWINSKIAQSLLMLSANTIINRFVRIDTETERAEKQQEFYYIININQHMHMFIKNTLKSCKIHITPTCFGSYKIIHTADSAHKQVPLCSHNADYMDSLHEPANTLARTGDGPLRMDLV